MTKAWASGNPDRLYWLRSNNKRISLSTTVPKGPTNGILPAT
jgi:hypothetical protein